MNIHKTNDDRWLAKLVAYVETYDRLDSAIDEAEDAISVALAAVEIAREACEETRDEAAKQSNGEAYRELDGLCALIKSAQDDLEVVSMPSTFRRRVASLRHTLEQERAASDAAPATVKQD